eukprot:30967-Pelagococcus_subviridis.AAC.11
MAATATSACIRAPSGARLIRRANGRTARRAKVRPTRRRVVPPAGPPELQYRASRSRRRSISSYPSPFSVLAPRPPLIDALPPIPPIPPLLRPGASRARGPRPSRRAALKGPHRQHERRRAREHRLLARQDARRARPRGHALRRRHRG